MDKNLEWEINLVKERYHWLSLDDDQAQQIYCFENRTPANLRSFSHHLSFWEEQDYQLTEFARFLNPGQLDILQHSSNEIRENYENQIRLNDEDYLSEIEYVKELLTFYKVDFLPALSMHDHMRTLRVIGRRDPKIALLKAEFVHFIEDYSNTMLVLHFREYRHLANKRYERLLLQAESNRLWPDYHHFKNSMDIPTKSCAVYIYGRYSSLEDETKAFIESKYKQLQQFFTDLKNKYFEPVTGLIFKTGVKSSEQIQEAFFMNMLLAPAFENKNEQKYG